MPSLLEETCGLAALEAMAHGRPILVSALGGLPELVREGTGLACLPGDVDDLSEKIKILDGDDAFSRDAGHKAWELCRREYSPNVHLSRLQEVYESCVSRGSA
jgi:glycosyltransferase involved in cell wall biosynthesis